MNYLNPNWLLARLLERLGIATYLERTEFAAHFFASITFALVSVIMISRGYVILGPIISFAWMVWTLIDEFIVDGWKGRDTLIDLLSKLIGPIGLFIWILFKHLA